MYHQVMLGYTGKCLDVLGYARMCKDVLGYARLYQNVLEYMSSSTLFIRWSQRCSGPGGGLNTHPTGKQRTREPKQFS